MSAMATGDAGLQNLLTKLQRVRDRAEATDDHELYLDLVEICAYCEVLVNESRGEPVDIEILIANLERRHLHVVSSNVPRPPASR